DRAVRCCAREADGTGGDRPMTSALLPTDAELAQAICAWLPGQRWYAGKHREPRRAWVEQRITLADGDDYRAEHVVATVVDSPSESARYQIPLGYRARLPDGCPAEAALPGEFSPIAYDGLRDPEIAALYPDGIRAQRSVGPIRFVRNGYRIADTSSGRVLNV